MGTRGFVGFKHNGKIKGWYNHNDSYYEGLGTQALEKYMSLDEEQIKTFFLEKVKFVKNDPKDEFYQNHRAIFGMDWKSCGEIKLQDGSSFLWDGLFCEYGYVFDLENDSVDVYRGFFKTPQTPEQNKRKQYYKSGEEKYYSHRVLTVNRNNERLVKELFENENSVAGQFEGNDYYEQAFFDSRAAAQ